MLYYLIKLLYVLGLNDHNKAQFAEVVKYFKQYADSIPLSFVLGFYVNLVMSRWWDQYKSLPWPDTFGIQVSTMVEGLDERSRMMRRTVMRYLNLSYVLALTLISPRVKIRFPTLDHVVDEGFLEPNEKKILENLGKDIPHSLYWLPLVWASSILKRARKDGLIKSELSFKVMMESIIEFRSGLASLLGYNSISIPLVYTQVVTLAVYSFFAGTLISSQYVEPKKENADNNTLYTDVIIPWFALLQYLFYVGWLKVAETLVNPFGTDDDDFELDMLIDRNFQVGYLIVDAMHDQYPELIQDKYWDDVMPRIPLTPEFNSRRSTHDNISAKISGLFKDDSSPILSRVMRSALERTTFKRKNTTNHGSRRYPQKLLEEGELGDHMKLNSPFILPLSEEDDKKGTRYFKPASSAKNSDKGSLTDCRDGILFADDDSVHNI